MSSLKRKRNNNNSRIFIEKEDVIIELTYNYKKYDTIDKKILPLLEKTPSLIVNENSKLLYKNLLLFINSVAKEGFCTSLLKNYVDYYYKTSDAIITLQTIDENFIGYCMLSFDKDYVNAHLICGNKKYKNVGTIILDVLKDLVDTIGFERVVLKSTTEALPFYLKRGYECINEECPMEFIVKKSALKKKNSTIKKKKTNNTDK